MNCPSSAYGTHRCIRCDSEIEEVDLEQIEDLKARLSACREIIRAQVDKGTVVKEAMLITDLRVKKWTLE